MLRVRDGKNRRAVRHLHAPGILAVVLSCAFTSSGRGIAASHDAAPRLTSIQAVAAVKPTNLGWSQRAGNSLVARVMTNSAPSERQPFGLVAYDLDRCQLIWMTNSPDPALGVSPYVNQVVDGKLVFWGYEKGSTKLRLYLADLRTGRSRSVAPAVADKIDEETKQISPLWTAPLTAPATDWQGHVFLGTPVHARAISAETGELDWEARMPWPAGPASYRPYPTFRDVYFYSELGRVAKIEAGNGELLWSRDLLGIRARPDEPLSEDVEGPAMATMIAVGGGRVFFCTGEVVYALSDDDGRTLWKTEVAEHAELVPYQPLVWGRMVVVVVRDLGADQFKALDVTTGEVVWTWELGQIAKYVEGEVAPEPCMNEVSSNLLVVGDELLFCTIDGVLRALGNDSRGEHWQLRLRPQSSPYADFAATLHLVGSDVVAFDGTTAWWIAIPSAENADGSAASD